MGLGGSACVRARLAGQRGANARGSGWCAGQCGAHGGAQGRAIPTCEARARDWRWAGSNGGYGSILRGRDSIRGAAGWGQRSGFEFWMREEKNLLSAPEGVSAGVPPTGGGRRARGETSWNWALSYLPVVSLDALPFRKIAVVLLVHRRLPGSTTLHRITAADAGIVLLNADFIRIRPDVHRRDRRRSGKLVHDRRTPVARAVKTAAAASGQLSATTVLKHCGRYLSEVSIFGGGP